MTLASGITPYRKNVTKAPSTVPWVDVASATVISKTTNIQAMGTMCISDGDTQYRLLKIEVIMR
jgi:hypothetical protein